MAGRVGAICADGSLVELLAPSAREGVVAIPRRRRLGRDHGLSADGVAAALTEAGPTAIVLARPVAGDPGAGPLRALASLPGRPPVVRLPLQRERAARVVGVAARCVQSRLPLPVAARAIQVLAASPEPPQDSLGERRLREAAAAWRPCDRCRGGGALPGHCAVCGAALTAAPPVSR